MFGTRSRLVRLAQLAQLERTCGFNMCLVCTSNKIISSNHQMCSQRTISIVISVRSQMWKTIKCKMNSRNIASKWESIRLDTGLVCVVCWAMTLSKTRRRNRKSKYLCRKKPTKSSRWWSASWWGWLWLGWESIWQPTLSTYSSYLFGNETSKIRNRKKNRKK